jgi:hypothetical protein
MVHVFLVNVFCLEKLDGPIFQIGNSGYIAGSWARAATSPRRRI